MTETRPKPRPSSYLPTSPFPTPSRQVSAKASNGKFHDYRGIFLLACGALLFYLTKTFIKPVVMGAIFAIVLYPLMERMRGWKMSEALRAALLTVGFLISFLIPIGVLVFMGADAALDKIASLEVHINPKSGLSGNLIQIFGLQGLLARVSEWLPLNDAQINQLLARGAQTAGVVLSRMLQSLLADIPSVLISTFVILLTLYFLLIDGRRAVDFVRQNSFFSVRRTDKLLETIRDLCHSVVVATIVSGVVQSTLVSVACLITGTPNTALIALITFIASFLPVIGTAPVTLFLTLQAFISGDLSDGIVFAVFMFLVGISDNIVRPYVLKGGGGLHPLVGFVAAFAALDAIGFYGLFIGPIVAGLFFRLLPMITQSFGTVPGKGK